jgi:hypothetical protein
MHFSAFLPISFVEALSVFFMYKNNTIAFSVRTSDAQETLAEGKVSCAWSWRPCCLCNPKARYRTHSCLLLSQSWDRWILSISSQLIKISFNNTPTLMHQGLPSCLLPFGFSIWNIVLKTTKQIARVKVTTAMLLRIQVTRKYVVNNYRRFD